VTQRILLLGAAGQVGAALQRTLPGLGEIAACDRSRVDLASADAIRSAVREFKPGIIVNAAAYTAVDRAESEPELAMAINGIAPGILAEEARKANALLVHYSTDYVFDGAKSGAYVEDDVTHPVSVYGRTKLAGEQAVQAAGGAHLIFRTSWVYGNRGANFMKTMLRLAKERDHLRVVADQSGAPTSSDAIAQATARCLAHFLATADSSEALGGLYHMTCAGQTSWHGFAMAIFAEFLPESDRQRLKVEAIATEDFPTPARRPRNSVLSNAKLLAGFGVGLPDWRIALHEVCASA
jgi:dTDP-4-dehydrorhamnose reductase